MVKTLEAVSRTMKRLEVTRIVRNGVVALVGELQELQELGMVGVYVGKKT